MKRRLLLPALAILTLQILLAASAAAQSHGPVARVAFLHDRYAASWANAFRDSLSREIDRILNVDYTVEMPDELSLITDGTAESARAKLEILLADPSVDIIVASGPLGSMAASHVDDLARPVIGCWILDTTLQRVPYSDGSSGRHNFTYVTTGDLLSSDLAALDLIVDYEHLTVIGSGAWVAALPNEGRLLVQEARGRASFLVAEGGADGILAALPPETDAVYLMPLINTSRDDIVSLLDRLADRGLPVLSLMGESDVRAGALLGVAPSDWSRRIYRRAALQAGQILDGEDAATMPVTILREDRMFMNMRTAARVGISPPFEVIIEAELIDEFKAPGTPSVDLRATMSSAQSRNRDIASSVAAVAAGAEQVNVAKAELLPQIYLGLGGYQIDKDTAAFFPTSSERTLSGSATLTQLIYSDRAWAGYTIEKHLQEARVGDLERTRLDVGLEAATAYFNVLRAQTDLQILRQNVAFSRSNLERAEVRVSVGDANRSELFRWESKIANELAGVMNAAVNLRLARYELNRVLALPLEKSIELLDSTIGDQYMNVLDPRVDRFTRDPANLEILREFLSLKGLTGAPELQSYDAAILAAERAHTAAGRSFWLPDFGLAGGADYVFARGGEGSAMDDPLLPDDTSWNVGLFASLPLLEGGARFAETRRTTQETYRLMRGREATAGRIDQNVRSATFQVAASRVAIDLARRSADAARNNLILVADNYTLGLVSLVDLLDAQTNALNAELAAVDTINRYLLDLMRVERAVGQFMFFVEPEDREAWIEELEEFARERGQVE